MRERERVKERERVRKRLVMAHRPVDYDKTTTSDLAFCVFCMWERILNSIVPVVEEGCG